jgi:hypothetical protein
MPSLATVFDRHVIGVVLGYGAAYEKLPGVGQFERLLRVDG